MAATGSRNERLFFEQLGKLLAEMGVGVFAVDNERRITTFNEALEKMTGYRAEEVIGLPCHEVFFSDLCYGECVAKGADGRGGSMAVEMEVRDQEGEPVRVIKVAAPLVGPGGVVSGCLEILQPQPAAVEVYRELLDRIRYDEHRLKLILESLDIGVFTVNREGYVTSFNGAAEYISGYQRRELLGQHHRRFMECDTWPQGCLMAHTVKSGDRLVGFQSFLRAKDGRRVPIRINFMALRNEQGRIIGGLGTFQDLSVIQQLNRAISGTYTLEDMIGRDAGMQQLFEIVPIVAASDATVLIQGATGTGKDLLARVVHQSSPRRERPFVKVNCAALPETLLESEMFGYVRGAFTGAVADKPGRFQEAHGGTIFLDEVGDLPLALQPKLLRVLEERAFYPLGGRELVRVDVRIIAATNRELQELVQERKFRQDLFYRLNVMRLELPPLASRRSDIPLLLDRFLKRQNATRGTNIIGFSEAAMDFLLNYSYPGNVRELENIVEHACILCQQGVIDRQHLPKYLFAETGAAASRAEATKRPQDPERLELLAALRRHRWHRQRTAKALGIDRTTLWRRMKKYGVSPR